jgi:hypothetical protein
MIPKTFLHKENCIHLSSPASYPKSTVRISVFRTAERLFNVVSYSAIRRGNEVPCYCTVANVFPFSQRTDRTDRQNVCLLRQ